MNRCLMVGEVGQEPKRQELGRGRALIKFTLCTSEKGKDGNTFRSWHSISVWSEALHALALGFKKGDLVYLEGKIVTKGVEKDGKTTYYTDIQVGPFGGALELLAGSRAQPSPTAGAGSWDQGNYNPKPRDDDAIPF